jgi:hypothetical protein
MSVENKAYPVPAGAPNPPVAAGETLEVPPNVGGGALSIVFLIALAATACTERNREAVSENGDATVAADVSVSTDVTVTGGQTPGEGDAAVADPDGGLDDPDGTADDPDADPEPDSGEDSSLPGDAGRFDGAADGEAPTVDQGLVPDADDNDPDAAEDELDEGPEQDSMAPPDSEAPAVDQGLVPDADDPDVAVDQPDLAVDAPDEGVVPPDAEVEQDEGVPVPDAEVFVCGEYELVNGNGDCICPEPFELDEDVCGCPDDRQANEDGDDCLCLPDTNENDEGTCVEANCGNGEDDDLNGNLDGGDPECLDRITASLAYSVGPNGASIIVFRAGDSLPNGPQDAQMLAAGANSSLQVIGDNDNQSDEIGAWIQGDVTITADAGYIIFALSPPPPGGPGHIGDFNQLELGDSINLGERFGRDQWFYIVAREYNNRAE